MQPLACASATAAVCDANGLCLPSLSSPPPSGRRLLSGHHPPRVPAHLAAAQHRAHPHQPALVPAVSCACCARYPMHAVHVMPAGVASLPADHALPALPPLPTASSCCSTQDALNEAVLRATARARLADAHDLPAIVHQASSCLLMRCLACWRLLATPCTPPPAAACLPACLPVTVRHRSQRLSPPRSSSCCCRRAAAASWRSPKSWP